MIAEGQRWFLDLVKTRRKVDTAAIPGLQQGRVYSGREALQYKLVDAIGGEDEAKEYLVTQRKLSADLKVIDWKPPSEREWPFASAMAFSLVQGLAELVGAGTLTPLHVGGLDGLVSVWHPAKN